MIRILRASNGLIYGDLDAVIVSDMERAASPYS
jgi:hypothetical protein